MNPGCNLNFLKLFLISWVLVLPDLTLPLLLSNLVNLELLIAFSMLILSSCPNHLSYYKASSWFSSGSFGFRTQVTNHQATHQAACSLFLNSTDDFLSLRLTLHMHTLQSTVPFACQFEKFC